MPSNKIDFNKNPLIKRDKSNSPTLNLQEKPDLNDQRVTIDMLIEQDAKTRYLNEKILESS